MDPSGTPLYEGIKQRIIAGEITYEQGRARYSNIMLNVQTTPGMSDKRPASVSGY